jgi:hypothetical protein
VRLGPGQQGSKDFFSGNCPGSRREAKASGGKAFFFEKKKQKTFGRFDFGAAGDAQPRGSKVFWFFFAKKEPLPSTVSLARGRKLQVC